MICSRLLGQCLVLAALAAPATAQTSSFPWQVDSIASTTLGSVRPLRIVLPQNYSAPETEDMRYPVLIMLDGDNNSVLSVLAFDAHWEAAPIQWSLPPMIIVAVPSRGERIRDSFPALTGAKAAVLARAGGADTFATFLISELLPWIRGRFRTVPFTVLTGHSATGHLAIRAYARNAGAFQGVIASSPALWWVDDSITRDYARAIAAQVEHGRVFIGVGGHDPGNLKTSDSVFMNQFRQSTPRSAVVEHRVFPMASHPSVLLPALLDGLRWIFEPMSLSANPMHPLTGLPGMDSTRLLPAYEATRTRYATNARRMGLPDVLPRTFLRFWALARGPLNEDYGLAPRVCADYVAMHPNDPWAYECVAQARLRQADTTGARRELARALVLARRRGWTSAVEDLNEMLTSLDSATIKNR